MNRNPDEAASSPSPRARKVLDAFDHALAIDEPVPDELVRRAQELYVWRAVDAELLELLVDSAQQDLAVVRDEQLLRFMAFGTDERGCPLRVRVIGRSLRDRRDGRARWALHRAGRSPER